MRIPNNSSVRPARVLSALTALLLVCCFLGSAAGCGKKAPFDAEAAFNRLLTEVQYEAPLSDLGSAAEIMLGELPAGATAAMYTAGGTSEDALIMLTGVSEADASALEKIVNDYIADRLYEAERYNPDQAPKLKSPVVYVGGSTVIACITNDTQTANSILYGGK